MRAAPLILVGLASAVLWAVIAASGDLSCGGIPRFLLLYGAVTLLYLAGVVWAVRRPKATALWVIVGVAVVCRLAMLAAPPSLSHDSYRYLWEGQVQAAGHNPYTVAPDDPLLADQRDGTWLRVNHPEVSAIYGPLLELLFVPLALTGSLLAFKLVFLLADLGLGFLVARGLTRRGLSPALLLIYAWHPLLVLEIAGQGHLEVIPIALMLLAVELELAGRRRWAALALGCAIGTKYLPLLLVPAFLSNVPGWKKRLERLGLIALPVGLAALPYLAAGPRLVSGLVAYGQKWRFNDGGFLVVDWLLEASGISQAFCRHVLPVFVEVPAGFDPAQHTTWMRIPPKLVVGLIAAGVVLKLARRPEGQVDIERAAFWAGGLFLLLSPTVHPWYVLWIVPFLPGLKTRWARAGWLHLSLVAPLAYVVLLRYSGLPGSWQEASWVRVAEYLPLAVLVLVPLGSWFWVMKEERAAGDDDPCDTTPS